MLRLEIAQDPLPAFTLAAILSAFTELHTKCWLIQKGRFADLMDYTQTHQPRLAQEANLVITKLSYNSPAEIIAAVASFIVGGALVKGIDGILQTRLRYQRTQLELESKQRELKRQKAEVVSDDKERQLQLREHEIAVERQQLELDKAHFQWEQERLTIITETATIMVQTLQPEADPQTKAMAARALVPQLLAFGQVQGLEITLLAEPEPPQEGNPPSPPADAAS